MIKWLFILLFSFSIGLFSAQSSDAKKRMLNMVEKLERVPPYSCDVNINIDVKFIRIKERVGKMIYRSPEDIDYKIKGFAFLPKKEMGTTSTSLFKDDFIAIDMGKENENQIIKVIPMDINSEIVTGQFWIDSADLVQKMILITKEKGSYTAEMNYNGTLYDLPSKIRMSFDVKNQKMPALLTGDLEAYTDETDEDEVSKGTITIMYSNHQF
ncbi:MAG: hypothetical protein VX312_04105 [Bacteroidota bacterium]|nr:hypothetical protein [Bacteroidota bacterium]MEE3097815.1 hypothetical protein [Bacteroidota bacterium]